MAGTAAALTVMVLDNIQPGRLVGSACIRVALFCLLGLATGWGGFHLLRTGLPAALLGNGVRKADGDSYREAGPPAPGAFTDSA